jgi:uncharacterized protein YndB with AHSA1/START domain
MTMHTETAPMEIQTFTFSREVEIAAPIEVTFESVLAELGPENEMPGGQAFPMTIEARPGGRWVRDLGNDIGHLWGHVQVIKPPTLLEICGPLFISFPATNHVQYRLSPQGNAGTKLKFTHRAFGYMPKDFVKGVEEGWEYGLKRVAEIAKRRTQR